MGNNMRRLRQGGLSLAGGLTLIALTAGVAAAQSASGSLSAFSRGPSTYESPVNVSTRDADGNMTIVNGVMQSPQGSIFSNLSGMGAASSSAGAGSTSSSATGSGGASGSGSAVAIGNNLNVVVNGDYNTVIVNSSQTNTGAVSASTVLNGKVNLDGGQ